MNAVAGGHVTGAMAALPNAAQQVKSGQFRALAFASAERVADLPDVPTMIESGFAGVEADLWYGLVAPAGTPPSVIAELEKWVVTALKEPELVTRFKSIGLFTTNECGSNFARFMQRESDKSGAIIRAANIRP
jgi:tripartite-type tricarboxylate transporter receptor subunit TctC